MTKKRSDIAVMTRIAPAKYRKLKKLADAEDRSLASYVRLLIDRHLERQK